MSSNVRERIKGLCSVIMPIYNCEAYVGESIKSVLNQDYRDLELLIVDDCSTDASIDIARRFAMSDQRVMVYRLEHNSGCAAARNFGLKYAQGEYIAFIDGDDVWYPTKLAEQVATLASSSKDMAYTGYRMVTEVDESIKERAVPVDIDVSALLKENFVIFSTTLFKAEKLQGMEFSSAWFHEDYVFLLEFFKQSNKGIGINKVLVDYRVHAKGRSYNKFNAAKNRWIIYRKFLELGILESLYYFMQYAFNGIVKYK